MGLKIGELVAFLTVEDKGFHKALDAAERGLERVGSASSGIGKGAGLAILAGQALQLGAAVAPAAGAMLAMPAAMVAVKGSALVLKLGLIGVSDAMSALASGDTKKLDAALKELAPSARNFVKELGTLKTHGFDPIQKAVQGRLFDNLVGPLKTAASSVLPTARSGLVAISGALNGLAREALRVASTETFRGEFGYALKGVAGVINTLRGAVGPLVIILLKLVNLGQPLLQRMAAWAVEGAKAAAAFLQSRDGASQMSGIVQRAGDTLATLGRIAGNIGTGLVGIFKNAGQGSGDLLGTIEKLTGSFAAWSQSAKGQQQIAAVFSLLAQAGKALGGALPVLVGPLGAIAKLLTSLPAPAQDVVAKLLAFSVLTGTLAGKLGPAISAIRLLGTGIGKIPAAINGVRTAGSVLLSLGTTALTASVNVAAAMGRIALSAATAAARFAVSAAQMIAQMALTAGRVVAGWVLMGVQSLLQAARVAAAWVLAMGPIGWIITAVVALVALIIANWDTIKNAIAAAWQWIKDTTVSIWNGIVAWFSAFWSNLKAIFQTHVDWVRNLIARVWAAIQQTNATIWNAIKNFFSGLWSGVKTIFQSAVDKVKSVIDGAWNVIKTGTKIIWDTVTGYISTAWTNIKTAVSTGISNAITLVKGLPGKILAGLGKLGNLLLSAGKDLINGLINGVKQMATKLIDSVKGVINSAIDGAKKLLGIASPSRVFMTIGQQMMAGMADGIHSGGMQVLTATLKIAKQAAQVVKGAVMSGPYSVPAAQGEIARLLGGAKFGLDVQAITPTPAPAPAPTPKSKAKPRPTAKPQARSDPNDVTFDRGPTKPRRDPNDATVDRNPPKKDNAGYVQPSAFNVVQHFHAANVSAGQVSSLMWMQAHAAGF